MAEKFSSASSPSRRHSPGRTPIIGEPTGKGGQMHRLLGEFKGLYEGKLKKLDDAEKAGEENSKMRARVLQSYVNDLSEQNEVLVQTVEELEREANSRVQMLEGKLSKTSSSVKEYMSRARDLERELRNLTIEKTRSEALSEDLQSRLLRQEEVSSQLRQENSNLNHDVDQLITVISTARSSGRWEIDRVRFRELTVEQVFGSLHETYTKTRMDPDSGQMHELRDQIRRRDDKIDALQMELKRLRSDSKVVSDQLNDSTDRDPSSSRLKSDLRKLEQRVEDLNFEIQSRDRKITAMTAQLSDLQTELTVKDSESSNFQQTIKMLQDKHRQTQLEATKSEEVIRQLRAELSSFRDQHSQSAHDVSHYERRIRSLEGEVVESKEQRRKNLDEIGALQERLRDSQVSTHDHHEILKSELSRRDDTIQKLRRDVLNLQEKRDGAIAEVHRCEKRIKSLEDEVLQVRSQLEDSDNQVKTGRGRITRLESELQTIRNQNTDFQAQVGATGKT